MKPRPFEGVRVLDLTRATAGPFATLLLADLGATVVKIETHEFALGVTTRQKVDPDFLFHGDDLHFHTFNRNKKSILLDLKHPEGREVFYDLVKVSDVVVDNMRPGALKRLGLDYETLRRVNPRIISCSITGFGSEGPDSEKPAFDWIVQASSGFIWVMDTRDEQGRPRYPGIALADLISPAWAAYAVASALYARERTGEGQRVEVAMQDVLVENLSIHAPYWLNHGIFHDPARELLGGCVRTKDGYLMIAAHREGFWRNLCHALNRTEWLEDPRFNTLSGRKRHRELLWSAIEEITMARPTEFWLEVFSRHDVPCSPVRALGEVLSDPQILCRNMVVTIPHPKGGEVKTVGNAVKFAGVEEKFEPAPSLGEHTEEILREWLGYPEEKIGELRARGVI